MTDQPTAHDALRQLEPLAGEWRVLATTPGGEPLGEGRASFAWHESGAHLIARTSFDTPGAPNSVSIIGCDGANGTYVQLYADDRGVSRVYDMSMSDGTWKLWRDGQPFPQRFTARIEDDGRRMVAQWEKAEDGTDYTIDFHLTYIRAQ
jgi:hypothetical protein